MKCVYTFAQQEKKLRRKVNFVRRMPHNPHFRRDVEQTTPNKELEEIAGNDKAGSKTYNKFLERTRLLLPFIFGGVASCVAEIATFPIDTAKTRLQLQGQARDKRHSSTPYRGM